MSDVNGVTNGASSNIFTNAATNTLGKDDFLQLLVTKMTNQDPLEPMKDEQFIAELAQFSQLEQTYNMNQLLQNSSNMDYLQMQTINNTMATNLIGKDVQASYDSVYLGDTDSPEINYSTDKYATEVKVTITKSDGTVVRTLTGEEVAPGDNTITWDGKDENGNRVASDVYSVSIEARDANGDDFTPSTYVRGLVEGVVYRDGSALLKVNGMEISLANVEQILDNAAAANSEEDGG